MDVMMDAIMMRMVESIAKYGVAVTYVGASDNSLTWGYTVGLTGKGQPELAVLGLPSEVGHPLLNQVARKVIDGEFTPREGGELTLEAEDDHPAVTFRFRTVPVDGEQYPLNVATLIYPAARAMQVVWPDDGGHYPGDPEFTQSLGGALLMPAS